MLTCKRMLAFIGLCCFLLIDVRVGSIRAQPDIHYEISARLSPQGGGSDVSWSPDGSRLAGAGFMSTDIWDTTNWKFQQRIPLTFGSNIAWSPDGEMLAGIRFRHETVSIWDADTGELIKDLTRLSPPGAALPLRMHNLVWSPDGTKIATDSGIAEDTLLIWDWISGAVPQVLVDGYPEVSTDDWIDITELDWSRNGRWLLSGGIDGNGRAIICLWDAATGNAIQTISPGFFPIWTKEDRQFAGFSLQDETLVLQIWDAETGDILSTLDAGEGGLKTLAWNDDKEMIAGAGSDHLYLWDVANGIKYDIEELPLNNAYLDVLPISDVRYVEWRPHSDQLVVSDEVTGIWILDFEFGE